MLHALLHNKLDESAFRRREDVVTSSVFGTLLCAGAGEELAAWINQAKSSLAGAAAIQGRLKRVWFWPRLTHAEPDVVLQFENRVVIVEAKVAADRHDLHIDHEADPEDSTTITDQLCRQWHDATAPNPGPMCPSDLAAAFRSTPPVLIFLIDERRLHRATLQFDETVVRLPAADIRLLTWQTLYRLLIRTADGHDQTFWRSMLVEYLEYTALAGYVGFQRVALPTHQTVQSLRQVEWTSAAFIGERWKRLSSMYTGHSASQLMKWAIDSGAKEIQ